MALILDTSTPASAVIITGGTVSTSSFTPPAGAVLYICIGLNAISVSNLVSSVTDNRASPLTYTQVLQFGNDVNDVQAYLYTATVTTSVAMTVSATQTDAGRGNKLWIRVLVITGADTATPVGAGSGGRGRTTNISGTAAQYVSTRADSWGWLLYTDWLARGIPTAGTGVSLDASYHQSTEDDYATLKMLATTPTLGTTVTLSTSAPTTGLQLSWLYFEMLPVVIPPNPTGLTHRFNFFDIGDPRV